MSSITASFDMGAVDQWVDDLQADVQQAIRPATQAGSQLLYEAVLLNVKSSTKGHWFHGTSFKKNGTKYWFNAGTLRRAIYQAHSKDHSSDLQATYHISWNHKKAPYGFMVEYGTIKTAPVAFVRRANAVMPQALQRVEDEFGKRLKHFT